MLEALPLLERTVSAIPDDAEAKGWLSFALMVHAQTLNDPAARVQQRIRARKLAIEALKDGRPHDLVALVAALPEDGHEDAFSDKAEAEAAMKAGESAFAKRDFDAAISAYTRAYLLDPKTYYAALFIGDSFFAKREMGSAGQWFAKAIEIDPNIETAYRYWGDALASMANHEEARTKYIEAIIAEPYNRSAWVGLLQCPSKQAKRQPSTVGYTGSQRN
jgi:tetratricopeptide (TPR) repeat protein